jgi:nicotinamide riboside transporter PnuC
MLLFLRSFMDITATILTIAASFFLIKANFGLTPNTIARLSCTIQGWFQWATANEEAIAILSKQSAYTRGGFMLLIVAFLLQMSNLLRPMTIDEIGADNYKVVLLSIAFCTILILITYLYCAKKSNKNMKEGIDIAEKMLKSKETTK